MIWTWTEITVFFAAFAVAAGAISAVLAWRSWCRRKAERLRRLFIQRLTDAQ